MSLSIFPDRYFYCTSENYFSFSISNSVNAQVSNILSIATSHFGTKVTVVDFMCYFSIPSPLKQFERYLSSFMADKCTFHINLPLGFDRMDTYIYLSLSGQENKKKNVILKNCFSQNNAIKRDKNKLHRYNTIYSVILCSNNCIKQ